MDLILLEHKKLWSWISVRISVVLCFVYVVIVGGVLCDSWFIHGTMNRDKEYYSAFDRAFDGYGNIRAAQEYVESVGDSLTDETLQQMMRDYQDMMRAGKKAEADNTDWSQLDAILQSLWPELQEPYQYDVMFNYVEPEKVTGFYERRRAALEDFLTNSNQNGAEREMLLAMDAKVEEPYRYGYSDGWANLLTSKLSDLGTILSLFLAISLGSMFAGEWHDNTSVLLLTTKNGWRKAAVAKLCAGFAFTVELVCLVMAGIVVEQLFYFGTAGWDMPIQVLKPIAVAPVNMLQAALYEAVFAFLGALGFAGIVMLLSSLVKSNVAALLLSLSVAYLPGIIGGGFPVQVQKLLGLIPLVGSPADIFRTDTFHIFGRYIWSPWLLITVPVLLGALCVYPAVRRWARQNKR